MNNELIIGKEKINDLLLDIMKQNNVDFVSVEIHDTANHNYSGSVEQRMINAVEDANNRLPMLHKVHFNNGGTTRTLSSKEIINEWHSSRFEDLLNFREMFEQQFSLNPSRYFDEINKRDSYHIRDREDRLDQRYLPLEEFKEEVMSRNRPRNDWFRNKHEKKRFIKGL